MRNQIINTCLICMSSVSYNTYSQSDAFKDGKEGQLPVEGTINRGFEAL